MARKAYSEEDRVQVRNALMTTMIQCIADRGLIHSSIDVLCRKVGISKTFFYSFFSSKEELVLYALRYQQPKLLDYARSLMEDPGLSWRADGGHAGAGRPGRAAEVSGAGRHSDRHLLSQLRGLSERPRFQPLYSGRRRRGLSLRAL